MPPTLDHLPRRPRLHRSYYLIEVPDSGSILLYREGRGVQLKPLPGSDLLPRLLGLLDGSRTVPELVDGLTDHAPELVIASLTSLHSRGLLEDGRLEPVPADQAARARLDEQLLLSHLIPDGVPAALEALASASVLLAGGGATASALARMLSACGVGHVHTVPAAELVTDGGRDSGRPPADIGSASVVVAALDHPDPQLLDALNAVCLDHSVGLLPAVLTGWEGHLGPTCIPGRTACLQCASARAKSNLSRYQEYLLYEQALRREPAGHPFGHLPHFSEVLAGLAATEVVKLITNCHPAATYGRVLVIDLLLSETESHDVLRVPRCPACSRFARRAQGKARYQSPSWLPVLGDGSA